MVAAAARRFEEPAAGPLERLGFSRLDPMTALAAVALIAVSIVVLGETSQADALEFTGNQHYYVIRQAIYAVVGIALMLAVARVDYSRFRELRVGIYTAMVASIILVLILGAAARGSRRWIELPFFTFQPSELGKVLLVVALAGFVIDRARRAKESQRTARLLLLGIVPALIVFVQPDLGTALVYGVVTLAVLFVAGIRWTHFAFLGGL